MSPRRPSKRSPLTDQEALDGALLLESCRQRVYRLTLLFGHSPSDADDIAQDAAMRLMNHPELQAALHGRWLLQITLQCIAAHQRPGKRLQPLLEEPAVEAEELHESQLDAIWEVLSKLSQREIFFAVLRFQKNWPVGELAELLGISHAAAIKACSRLRQRLRRELKDFEGSC